MIYTPLCGAGYRIVPEVLRRIGVKHLSTVDCQMTPDGNFPGLAKPNPEYPAAFTEGIKVATEVKSDLIIATDPDCDRVGVMARAKVVTDRVYSSLLTLSLPLQGLLRARLRQPPGRHKFLTKPCPYYTL